jgi:hypothetical protein
MAVSHTQILARLISYFAAVAVFSTPRLAEIAVPGKGKLLQRF